MPRLQVPLNSATGWSWASSTICCVSRGEARANSMRLWQSRT